MESVGFLSRIPDQTVIAGKPGAEVDHARATRGDKGRYALVYLPTGMAVSIRMQKIRGPSANILWFNPRDGSRQSVGTYDTRGTHQFEPPTRGRGQDWVLMILSESLDSI